MKNLFHITALSFSLCAGAVYADDQQTGLTQAVMEGVGFAFRDNINALNAAGTTIQQATAVGGGANSVYWLKTISTILNIPINIPTDGDFGAAFGAARLAMIAAEGADPAGVCTAPDVEATIEPQGGLTGAYDEAYQRFRLMYPLVKGLAV